MKDNYLILLVEESANTLGLYNAKTGEDAGRVVLSLWPHEIAVSADGRTAYVSNFGLRDYDLTIGYAGNAVSMIDIPSRCEVDRLYTCTGEFRYWAPHGVKISPDGKHLYVNVERVQGSREPDASAILGQQQTKLLVYDLKTKKMVRSFFLPAPPVASMPEFDEKRLYAEVPSNAFVVLPGMHNFVFSPNGKHLWYYSGLTGVTRMNPETGEVTARLTDFNGSVRALAFMKDGQLLVSATNEISLVDPEAVKITKKIGSLGVTQLLYSKATPDVKYVLAPAVWEGQVLIIDLQQEKVIKRIVTGIDPVQVMIAPDEKSAYVTHGRSRWLSEIEFEHFTERRRIATQGGPNGAAFAPWFDRQQVKTITLGAALPFTGEYAVEAREIRLGYQFWQDRVNASGGIFFGGHPHHVEIVYADTDSTNDEGTIKGLITDLIQKKQAQVILGTIPYVANIAAARVADDAQVPFITGTEPDESLFGHGFKYAFGVASSSTASLSGIILSLWRHVSPKPRTFAILCCDNPQSLHEAVTTAEVAIKKGMSLLVPEKGADIKKPGIILYRHQETHFDDVLSAVRDLGPDVFMHFGHREEAIAIVPSARAVGFTPGIFALNSGITISPFRAILRRLADNLTGSVQWSESLDNCANDRFIAASDFSRNYFTEYSEKPSSLAAGASACGVVLEEALRQADSDDGEDLTEALRELRLSTFFGPVKFDKRGLNTAKGMLTVQLKRTGAESTELIVWPPSLAGKNSPIWPFPGWPDSI